MSVGLRRFPKGTSFWAVRSTSGGALDPRLREEARRCRVSAAGTRSPRSRRAHAENPPAPACRSGAGSWDQARVFSQPLKLIGMAKQSQDAVAAMAVAAVKFRFRLQGLASPVGPATDRVLAGLRREGKGRGRGARSTGCASAKSTPRPPAGPRLSKRELVGSRVVLGIDPGKKRHTARNNCPMLTDSLIGHIDNAVAQAGHRLSNGRI